MNAAVTPDITIERLESGDIDAGTFDHESHVYLGWLYVGAYPLPEAISRFSAALKRLVKKLGAEGKYHETITWFYLLLIAERRSSATDHSWFTFRRQNSDLFARQPAILQQYYSDELLGSDRARAGFVLPDRVA